MAILERIETMGHEQVVFFQDPQVGLKAIVAIHDTTLGPALGGCRFWNYKKEDYALIDVLRLSRGMTYKASITNLDLGGGKSVIIGDPNKLKSEAFFRSFGKCIDSLGGRYITAEDVNVGVADINRVAKETSHVVGVTSRKGGSGDPSPFTALGVFSGIKACVKYRLKKDTLRGLRVAVQGLGSVGKNLCHLLFEEGVQIIVSDIDAARVSDICAKYKARSVAVEDIHRVDADVFSPCALGGVFDANTISQLNCPIVAGGANNQLLDEQEDGMRLKEKGILYAPDYVINAGGLINVSYEIRGYDVAKSTKDTKNIYNTLMDIFIVSEKRNIPTHKASDYLAEKRIKDKQNSEHV
jgi:leucine dehydrogenase